MIDPPPGRVSPHRTCNPRLFATGLALALVVLRLQRASAEDGHVDYRYESYQEDNDRIKVETHSILFQATLKPRLLAVKGEIVYDAISGATPTGAAPAAKYDYNFMPVFGFQPPISGNTNNTSVPTTPMHETRHAVSLELPITLGQHEITPQFSYSEESDYISRGAALNYAVQLNEKNTTLNAGWAHTWDSIRDDVHKKRSKDNDDFLIGWNQVIGPKTLMSLALTYGHASGYMNDPYRFIVAANDPQLDADNPAGTFEKRPDKKDKVIVYGSLTQFISQLNGSVDTFYRFYHDDFGIDAHTTGLSWRQKIGRRFVVSPEFRYHHQTAANFYYELLPDVNNPPKYFSPDYRLSELQSFTYGVSLMFKASDFLTLDAAYKRYVMEGLDGVTSQSAYPAADIFTIGMRLNF